MSFPEQPALPRPSKKLSVPARCRRFVPPEPTTTKPDVYGLSNAPFRIFGFALTREFLNDYCRRHDITALDRSVAHNLAIRKIKDDADVVLCSSLKAAYTGGFDNSKPKPNYAFCLVLANNKPLAIRLIDDDVIKRVQEAMGVDATPMWYKQF